MKVTQPPLSSDHVPNGFRAGAAEVDITPPLGLPHFGHSLEGAKKAKGVATRLKARVIVFEDPQGQRLAIAQLDLGAVSGLLHREVARRLAGDGIGPGQLILLATHTHQGPGGFFGARFYNRFGSGRKGFDEALVDWLASRISSAVLRALSRLVPAVVSAGEDYVQDVSRNRSIKAWEKNLGRSPLPYKNGLRPLLRVVRVDRQLEEGETTPLAALAFFPAHATAVGAETTLYQGDVHGVASRVASAVIQAQYKLDRAPVVALAAGAEGDISPDWKPKQSLAEARRLGRELGVATAALFDTMGSGWAPKLIDIAYIERPIPGADTTAGKLCDEAVVGLPTVGGAEDGRSMLYGKFGIREGHGKTKPKGCQTYKIKALGFLQDWLLDPEDFPRIAPMHLVRMDSIFTLTTVPGEPTTEVGRQQELILGSSTGTILLGGLGNEYIGYWTMEAEYDAQHYEGGSTLYGPASQAFLRDTLIDLEANGGISYETDRIFRPGKNTELLPSRRCSVEVTLTPGETSCGSDGNRLEWVTFGWRVSERSLHCPAPPKARIECAGSPLVVDYDRPETEEWINFEISRKSRRWQAKWVAPPGFLSREGCRLMIEQAGQLLESAPFSDQGCR